MGNTTDIAICKALGGSGEELGRISIYCVRRRGYLLLALPANREAALVTLKLYQPQVFAGKAVALGVGLLIRAGLQRLLPHESIAIRENGPLAKLVDDQNKMGFMLGNPEAHIRRALVVHQQGNDYVVDKVGLSKEACQSVKAELEVIKGLPRNHKGIPTLHSEHTGDNWVSYTTSFNEGFSPGKDDDSKVISVLDDWMKAASTAPLSHTRQWREMADFSTKNEGKKLWAALQASESIDVKLVIYHGDFAPWNIKISTEGEVIVLDWETGAKEGPAGWDWLHYIIQRATLVDQLNAGETLTVCRKWAKSEQGSNFLDKAGWGEHTEQWIGCYLAYSSWIAGFDRKDLIKDWIDTNNG